LTRHLLSAPMNERSSTAPLRLRVFALAYDLLALLGLWFLAGVLALALTGGTLDPHRLAHRIFVQALVTILCSAYFIISWMRGGQTLGMRAWRLRVMRDDGRALAWRQALPRLVVGCISLAALGAGFWWALFDARHLTWHDRAARTIVVTVG
jgi:uncharacterized RDD family membrane protein YckC